MKINLKYILEKYPQHVNDANKFNALLQDLYAEDVRARNLILVAQRVGVANHIKKSTEVSKADLLNYLRTLENNYGIAPKYAYEAVYMWAEAYDKNIPSYEEENSNAEKVNVVTNGIRSFNDVIWQNDEVSVIYKGFVAQKLGTEIAMLWGNISVTNKTAKPMYGKVVNMKLNGEIIKEVSPIDIQPNAKNILVKTCWGRTTDLKMVGITKETDIQCASLEFVYDFDNRYFQLGQEKEHSAELIVEPYFL